MSDPLQIPNVWRAESLIPIQAMMVPTGFASLDAALGGGWPTPSLIEFFTEVYGIGELQLILALLRQASASAESAVILWLNPPYEPNAVALTQHGLSHTRHWVERNLSDKNTVWSMEQALRSGACSAVLAWADIVKMPSLRRVKLAVAGSRAIAVLYRPVRESQQASPATIRARLTPHGSQLQVSLLKVQGRKSCELTLEVEGGQRQS